jgi:5-formyltetrahydrofolate cyclo-ligase
MALPGELPQLQYALPVIGAAAGEMAFHRWRLGEPLRPNRYKILEPDPQTAPPLVPAAATIILVPCLAADRSGCRLGYGGGYYDRFLKTAAATTVGVVFADALVPVLPGESHDVRLAFVATERGVEAVT